MRPRGLWWAGLGLVLLFGLWIVSALAVLTVVAVKLIIVAAAALVVFGFIRTFLS